MHPNLDDLRDALESGPAVLLLRHAPRGEISDPRTGNDVPLTPEGRTLATQTGVRIAELLRDDDSVVVGHSPVVRCEQTAIAIYEGLTTAARPAKVIGKRNHLGGPYLVDPKPALDEAARLGHRFVREWFDGALPASLVQPRREAARDQVVHALQALDRPERPRLAVLVSHDWNLMLVREHVFGIRHEDAGWIDYLDGVAIGRSADGACLWYRRAHVGCSLA
ncbi:MAG: histidine phosphatase family protein [Planctomycetes bacterium]|nr:histidine phosphatase family protein [Planctomycetota bacterium]